MGSMALLNIGTLISDTTHFFLKVTNHYSQVLEATVGKNRYMPW